MKSDNDEDAGGADGDENSTTACKHESQEPPLKKLRGNIVKLRTAFEKVMDNMVVKTARTANDVLTQLWQAYSTKPPCVFQLKCSDANTRLIYEAEVRKWGSAVVLFAGVTKLNPEAVAAGKKDAKEEGATRPLGITKETAVEETSAAGKKGGKGGGCSRRKGAG